MQPDAHFLQHHDVEEPSIDGHWFRPAWRVRTRLDSLLLTGAIDLHEWAAASVYRKHWSIAVGQGQRSCLGLAYGSSRFSRDHHTIDRLDALAALRAVSRRITRRQRWLIEACVVDDMSWRAIGQQLDVHHHTARSLTIEAIKILTTVIHSAYR